MTPKHSGRPRRERKLPVQQLVILAVCRFAEPIASTSLFPYLPEMIQSFGVPQNKVGKWAGICSAMFSLCQAVSGIPWGRFADRYGRKPSILIGLTCTMLMSLLWGFSTSLPAAIIARGMAGVGSGIVGIIRTTVAEMVPFKELQPRAFSIMPLVWSIGSIFGPAFGGALANPYNIHPGQNVDHPNLLQRFPYLLPNLVSGCVFLCGLAIGILFLEETLETKHKRDYGLLLGDKLRWMFNKLFHSIAHALHLQKADPADDAERAPLLKATEDEENQPDKSDAPDPPALSYREVLNKQAVLNLVVYTLLALHNVGFDQLIPVFASYPPLGSKEQSQLSIKAASSNNPLQFAGGFGLNHREIGLINTCYGVCGMIIQFFVFPPVARKFGVLNCLRVCVCVYPLLYLIIPFTALLPTRNWQIAGCFAVMFFKCFCSIFSIPASTILLTNCASSLRVLGTLNGFATTFSALGRAAGPAIGGAIFSIGVERGFVIAPWWTFCAFALVAAIPVFFLVEGEGFGGDYDEVSDDEAAEGDAAVSPKTLTAATASEEARAVHVEQSEESEEQAEEAYGGMGPLSRTTTFSSAISLGSDEYSTPAASRESSFAAGAGEPSDMPSESLDTVRRISRADGSTRQPSRRNSHRVTRRTSLPIGMGSQGISRS